MVNELKPKELRVNNNDLKFYELIVTGVEVILLTLGGHWFQLVVNLGYLLMRKGLPYK